MLAATWLVLDVVLGDTWPCGEVRTYSGGDRELAEEIGVVEGSDRVGIGDPAPTATLQRILSGTSRSVELADESGQGTHDQGNEEPAEKLLGRVADLRRLVRGHPVVVVSQTNYW